MTTRTVRLLFPVCAFLTLAIPTFGAGDAAAAPTVGAAAKATPDAAFESLVDTFYGEYPAIYPTEATALGLHTHDGELEDLAVLGPLAPQPGDATVVRQPRVGRARAETRARRALWLRVRGADRSAPSEEAAR